MEYDFLILIGGLVILALGAEGMLHGAVAVAGRTGLSPLVIAATVVAFGTSAPELVVSLKAALADQPDITIGNIVGSNIANVLLILGVAAAIGGIKSVPKKLHRDGSMMLVGTGFFVVACIDGKIAFWEGAILVATLVAMVIYQLSTGKDEDVDPNEVKSHLSLKIAVPALIGGIAGLVIGADLFVDGAANIARAFGVSEAVIGLTLVAFGTSLPELAASGVAAARGHGDVALGNVVGSNLFNVAGIGGVAAMVVPLSVSPIILSGDLWIMVAVSLILVPMMMGRMRPGTPFGIALLSLYFGYVAFRFVL
ncbi:MAG: calcium/sodium antiporter [Alphaproteobacteria bacterium]|nr:calcium/sodium antiporter [Alphaproteobacteria bacterium]